MLNQADLALLSLHPVIWKDGNAVCACRKGAACKNVGKCPRLFWREAVLGAGEKQECLPGAGMGIATGARSKLVCVDLDGRGAIDTFKRLCIEHNETCPPTHIEANEDNDRAHVYFIAPDFRVKNSESVVAPGLDIRGDGGMVVRAGSPHKRNKPYRVVEDSPPAPLPRWLYKHPALRAGASTGKGIAVSDDCEEMSEASQQMADRIIPIAKEKILPSTRHEACKSLFGAIARELLSRGAIEETFSTCEYICNECGWDTDHLRLVNHALDRLESGENVYGFTKLLETYPDVAHALDPSYELRTQPVPDSFKNLGKSNIDKALENMPDLSNQDSADPSPPVRQIHNPHHKYSFAPGVAPAAGDIRKLTLSETGFVLSSVEQWRGVLQFDEFRQRVWAVNPPMRLDAEGDRGLSKADESAIRMWFEVNGSSVSADNIFPAVIHAAKRCTYHPVKVYLESCRAKRVPGILDTAATRILSTTETLANDYLRKTMIGAVRRIYKPGCQVDTMLTLYGPREGERKSTWCKVLFGGEFTRSQISDLANKDASIAMAGHWCCEMAELDRILRAESSTVKEFLTRDYDVFRPPYERSEIRVPRSIVFIGTTNIPGILRDAGRNRRFWIVPVGEIDLEWLQENRDAMWGEALALAEVGERHWYTRQEEADLGIDAAQAQYQLVDPWHDTIHDYLKGKPRVKVEDVYQYCVAVGVKDLSKYNRAEANRIVDTLRRLGCSPGRDWQGRYWMVPATIAADTPVSTAEVFRLRVQQLQTEPANLAESRSAGSTGASVN